MIFTDTPKFVVNLERRPDRLESVKKESDEYFAVTLYEKFTN